MGDDAPTAVVLRRPGRELHRHASSCAERRAEVARAEPVLTETSDRWKNRTVVLSGSSPAVVHSLFAVLLVEDVVGLVRYERLRADVRQPVAEDQRLAEPCS